MSDDEAYNAPKPVLSAEQIEMKRLEAKQEAKEEKQRLLNIEEARLVKAELEIMVKEEDGKKNSIKNG